MTITPEVEDRLNSLKKIVTTMRLDMDQVLNHLQTYGFSERQQEIIKWGYDQRIHMVNSELGSLKRKYGLPTQGDLKKLKKQALIKTEI